MYLRAIMTHELSILIPTYNHCCLPLVTALTRQARGVKGLRHEIIVADDGSTNEMSVQANQAINNISNCRYIYREQNAGRAAIRNFLARNARYQKLLFIDGDMSVEQENYLERFLRANGDVVYGCYHIKGTRDTLAGNLRFRYEEAAEAARNSQCRQQHPYHAFRTCNFLISRDIMSRYPFDERFAGYGFEDTLFAKTLSLAGISIQHIDNPLCFDTFENNTIFLGKTEESLRTLYTFKHELAGFSSLLATAQRLDRWHLTPLIVSLYKLTGKPIRKQLLYARPPLWVFNSYKLGYFMSIQRHP